MTITLAANSNNDIFIGGDGSLSVVSGLDAVTQACKQAAQAQLGEMVLSTDQGVPTFQTIWNGSPNIPQFVAYLRRTLMTVPDVIEVTALAAVVSDGVLSYTATIKTNYGEAAING
jgi:hypothetical protein